MERTPARATFEDLTAAIDSAREAADGEGTVYICRNPLGCSSGPEAEQDALVREGDGTRDGACRTYPELCPSCVRVYPDDRRTSAEIAEELQRLN